MNPELNETAVALGAGLPALVLLCVFGARKLSEMLPEESTIPGVGFARTPDESGWTLHFASGFLFLACVLAALSAGARGSNVLLGGMVGIFAAAAAMVVAAPQRAATTEAEDKIFKLKASAVSVAVHAVTGALLAMAYFIGSDA